MASNGTEIFWFSERDYWQMVAQTIHTFLSYMGLAFNMIIIYVIYKTGSSGVHFIAILAMVDIAKNLKEISDSSLRVLAIVQTVWGKKRFMHELVPRFLCLLTPMTNGDIIHYSYSQLVTAAIAVERCISVYKPFWYNKQWEKKEKAYRAVVLGYGTVVLAVHYGAYFMWPMVKSPITCHYSGSKNIRAYDYWSKLILAVAAAVITVVAVARGKAMLRVFGGGDEKKLMERLNRLNRTAAVVVLVNTVLVGVPNINALLQDNGFTKRDPGVRAMFWCLDVANSAVNLPVLLLTNADFRKRTRNAFSGTVAHGIAASSHHAGKSEHEKTKHTRG